MKRTMAVLLAVLMMLGCFPAQVLGYTVDEKFFGQAESQAVSGEITFSISGEKPESMDENLFRLLSQLVPGTKITFAATLGEKLDRGGYVQVYGADGSEKEVKFLFDEELVALGGNAIADEGVYYLLDGMPVMQQGNVSGMETILQAFDRMDEAWHTRAAERLSVYETLVSVWMNDYAGTAMDRDGDTLYSELSCQIPAAAVKRQTKDMLHILYQDQETLMLLGEALSGTGGEIFLNPAMESVFVSFVDALPLEGDVMVTRRFDSRGTLLMDSISLPLPNLPLPGLGDSLWKQIGVEMRSNGNKAFCLLGTENEKIDFALELKADGTVTGHLVTDVQGTTADGSLTHTGYDFAGVWVVQEETYSLQTDVSQRLMHGTLTLTPDGETEKPAQKITLDVRFNGKSSRGAPTTMVIELKWTEEGGDAQVAINAAVKTAMPFTVDKMDGPGERIPFTTLSAEQQQAVFQQLLLLALNQAVVLPE